MFTARVGTATTDIAGNNLAATYTHATGLPIDITPPTATYTTATIGGTSDGTDTILNAGDTVSVTMAFDEALGSTAPTVQFLNDSANLGAALTAEQDGVLAVALSDSTGDAGGTTDALDFGTVPSPGSSVLVREAVTGGGYVYKTEAALDSLYIAVSGDATTGVALKARSSTTKPTSATINTAGTEVFLVGSRGGSATVYGAAPPHRCRR